MRMRVSELGQRLQLLREKGATQYLTHNAATLSGPIRLCADAMTKEVNTGQCQNLLHWRLLASTLTIANDTCSRSMHRCASALTMTARARSRRPRRESRAICEEECECGGGGRVQGVD